MFFTPLIDQWGAADLAADLGIPTKNVRRWLDLDSIPADWFAAIARAARRRGIVGATEKQLSAIAERRRLAKSGDDGHGAAA